jgi:hypothetical protein
MFATAIALLLSSGTTAAAPAPELISGPIKMTASEIRAYNAKLPRDHPNYIRCTKVEATGSLVKKNASCRTNQQWAAADEAGNREARDIADRMSGKATPGN